jgi:bacterioferritin (cytochrome b1)
VRHAETLTDRILFLDGLPNYLAQLVEQPSD